MTNNRYTTLTYVEQEVRAETPFGVNTIPNSSAVLRWIEEASKEIELRSEQVFGSTLVSSEYVDYDGCGILRFAHSPLISIDELRYNQKEATETPDWVTLVEGFGENYVAYLDEAEAVFISGNNATNKITPKSGKQRLLVSYTYGQSSTPLDVQRLCTLMVTKRVIQTLVNSQANTEQGAVSVGSIHVADPTNYTPNYLKNLNMEIMDLFKGLGHDFKTYRITRNYDA